jgi:hypothetical protein
MSNLDNEPSNENIEDYNGHESKEKKNTVRIVVVFCLIVGAFFAYITTTSNYNDYIGTDEKPGIVKTK